MRNILIHRLILKDFNRGETAVAGMDTEYNAPNTALVGKRLSLTADSSEQKQQIS